MTNRINVASPILEIKKVTIWLIKMQQHEKLIKHDTYSQLLACFTVITTALLIYHVTVSAPNYNTSTFEIQGSLCATFVCHLTQKSFKKILKPTSACVEVLDSNFFHEFSALTDTFHVILHNQSSTSHLNMKKTFLALLEILLFAQKRTHWRLLLCSSCNFHSFKLSDHSVIPYLFCFS